MNESVKIKYIAPLRGARGQSEDGLPYLGLENIESGTGKIIESETPIVSDGVTSYYQKDDVLFGKLRPYLAKVVLAKGEGVCTGELLVLNPKKEKANPAFLAYRLRADDFIKAVDNSTYGSKMPRANWTFIGNQKISLPSLSEQENIVQTLDQKLDSVLHILARKHTLIEKLKEKRSTIIHHAITQGLVGGVKLIDSGVNWIGQVPEHWQVKKLKLLTKKPFQYGLNEAGIEDNPNNPRFIRITDVDSAGVLRLDTFASIDPGTAVNHILNEGDVLFARTGATAGKTFMYEKQFGPCSFAGYLIRFTPDKKILSPDFLKLITQSSYYEHWKNSIFIQATIQNISAEKYKELLIPVPPISEQITIVDDLLKKTGIIDNAIQRIEKSIASLVEYRSSLIVSTLIGV